MAYKTLDKREGLSRLLSLDYDPVRKVFRIVYGWEHFDDLKQRTATEKYGRLLITELLKLSELDSQSGVNK